MVSPKNRKKSTKRKKWNRWHDSIPSSLSLFRFLVLPAHSRRMRPPSPTLISPKGFHPRGNSAPLGFASLPLAQRLRPCPFGQIQLRRTYYSNLYSSLFCFANSFLARAWCSLLMRVLLFLIPHRSVVGFA